MAISHTGQQIFESITSNAQELPGGGYGDTNMFKILDSAIASLKTPIENDPAAAAAVISNAQIGIKTRRTTS